MAGNKWQMEGNVEVDAGSGQVIDVTVEVVADEGILWSLAWYP